MHDEKELKLEWADIKLQGINLSRKKDWEVTVNSFEYRPTCADPDPKVAIYKLLEKIMEKRNE